MNKTATRSISAKVMAERNENSDWLAIVYDVRTRIMVSDDNIFIPELSI
ncbi:hypothetical protein ES708_04987 [subsurface metagenome]